MAVPVRPRPPQGLAGVGLGHLVPEVVAQGEPFAGRLRRRLPAQALAVSAGGGASCSTVVLIEPEEIDKAAQKSTDYRPPGQ